MKLPSTARGFARRIVGAGTSPSIDPVALRELAAHEPVVLIAVGNVLAGNDDERLPGEHRTASLLGLAAAVADLPHDRAIVLHCG